MFSVISLAGCETIKDWTAKTTGWEIGVAQKVIGKGDAEKSKETKEEHKEKSEEETKKENPESDNEGDGIVGWTKRTTRWEMREADKVISDKGSSSKEEKGTRTHEPNGSKCRVKNGCQTANVRSGPSTKAAIVGKMRGGDSAEVIGEKSGWLNIKLKSGNKGWVSNNLVEYPAP